MYFYSILTICLRVKIGNRKSEVLQYVNFVSLHSAVVTQDVLTFALYQ